MHKVPIFTLLVLVQFGGLIIAEGKTLWSIGTPDNDYKEFAIAGDYGAYSRTFPNDVTFVIGKSESKKDWPYIQPAPSDVWAGAREHPFRIIFDLSEIPAGDCRFVVDFVNTHYSDPPTHLVDINGHKMRFFLPPGASDAALMDPKEGKEYVIMIPFPASLLRIGENVITLLSEEGSWVLYDALWLEVGVQPPAKEEIRSFEAKPTILFAKENGVLKQVIELAIDNWGKETKGEVLVEMADPPPIALRRAGKKFTVGLENIGFGRQAQHILVPEVSKPTKIKMTLKAGESTLTAETTLTPQRKWLVFVAPSVHTDIGYTDLQSRVIERHNDNTDTAIETCKKWSDFKWNLEVAWQAQNYLRDRISKARELRELAKQGRIGIQGLYLNMLTGLCSHEELNRICYFAKSLQREYGIEISSAMLTDVPTSVWTLPTVLVNSGVKYFAEGINGYRGPFFWYAEVKSPFWWQGPEGSKVLTWFTGGYAQAGSIGLHQSYERVYHLLPQHLSGYDRPDYPYDAVFIYGAFGDNDFLRPKFGEVAREWNSRWEYPKIIISTNAEFFKYIEGKFKDKIPTYKGDGGVYWEDGAASSAFETAINRRTHEKIVTAEKLHSIASMVDSTSSTAGRYKYPLKDFTRAWDKILLYDEHTWGAWCSISQPEAETTKKQWEVKASFAHDASKETSTLLQTGLKSLVSKVKTDNKYTLLVFNPLSWERADVITAEIPSEIYGVGKPFQLIDKITKKAVPIHKLGEKTICLLAENVPPLGYKSYEMVIGEPPKPAEIETKALKFLGNGLENKFYRISLDPVTGAISSIYDKELHKELVDKTSPYKVNQYLYVSGGEGSQVIHNDRNLPEPNFKIHSPTSVKILLGQNGPVFASLIVETSCEMTPSIRTELRLYKDIKRIDIINELTKTETYAKEAVYFAFPFNFKKPEFKLEIPNGVLRPEIDQLKGACKDWYAVQHWVAVSNKDYTVLVSTPDSPLITLCDLNRGKWLKTFEPSNGSVFAYVMNNYWDTNYKASQGGHFVFRFSITSHKGPANTLNATQFGWSYSNPLLPAFLPPNQSGGWLKNSASFFLLDRPNVILLTLKVAEDEKGWIIRLLETSGKPTKTNITLPFLKPKRAYLCNLVEENLKPLEVKDNTVQVPVGANSLATVRVK